MKKVHGRGNVMRSNRKKYILVLSFLALGLFGFSNKANAQGWPTFDVAHTVSEVTALIGDITKTVQKPMEILSFENATKSLGPLGESLGGDVMGKIKGTMGETLGKVQMKKDALVDKAKGSMDEGVKAVKKDKKIIPQEETQNMTQEEYKAIKAERLKRYKEASTEALSIALAQKARAAKGTTEKTDEIMEKAQAAEDKRGAYTANTMAVVEVCNELMMWANLEVAKLKMESTQALSDLPDISLEGDIKTPTSN